MGTYTELYLNVKLNPTPAQREVLDQIANGCQPAETPTGDPFFTLPRWSMVLCGTSSTFGPTFHHWDGTHLLVHSSIKNYDDEFEHFLRWLAPAITDEGFIGFIRVEDSDPLLLDYAYGSLTCGDEVLVNGPQQQDWPTINADYKRLMRRFE